MNKYTINTTQSTGEFPPAVSVVTIDGKINPYYTCLSIEENSGIMPSKAVFRVMPELYLSTKETTAPNTLNAFAPETFGRRVSLSVNGIVMFCGHLLKREDNGQADVIMWTAYDDRELLTKIPIRGAIVKNDVDANNAYRVNFLPRYNATFNPNGLWNCIGWYCSIPTHPAYHTMVPVFTSTAQRRQDYTSPDATFPELSVSQITAWTPRRVLDYLHFIAHLQPTDQLNGLGTTSNKKKEWRSIGASGLFDWPVTWSKVVGKEAGSTSIDPLDRKLPTVSMQGQALLQGIETVLTIAGTHELRVSPIGQYTITGGAQSATGATKSKIELYPVGYTATVHDVTTMSSIPMVRQGKASQIKNCNTAFDFQTSEDASDSASSVLVEGDVVRVETSLAYGSSIKKAWTDNEQTAFLQIIYGSASEAGDEREIIYAKYPAQQSLDNNTIQAFSAWSTADGLSGRPLAFARDVSAVQLARSIFPRVFRAFRIANDSAVTTALNGYLNQYSDVTLYPQAKINRPVLPDQLQFQIANMSGGTDGEPNWLETKIPVRVRIENNSTYNDVAYTSIEPVSGGVFMLDLAEQFDGTVQCIYSGKLVWDDLGLDATTLDCTTKNFILNIAFPMDHRVAGYAETSLSGGSVGKYDRMLVKATYDEATGGSGHLKYIDSPNTYKEEHQINSSPSAQVAMIEGSTTTNTPLNRILPPGSEISSAQSAAQRRLQSTQKIDRRSSWKMVGIRPEWRVGTWVNEIKEVVILPSGQIGSMGYTPYRINAAVKSVTHDFQSQITTIGGLIGESI